MKAQLDRSYFHNRRSWGPGLVDIPEDLAIALGLATAIEEPESGIPDSETQDDTTPTEDALMLINSANSPDQLTPIPGIGIARGRKLLGIRPKEGFSSLDQAAKMLADKLLDWEAIARWQFSDP